MLLSPPRQPSCSLAPLKCQCAQQSLESFLKARVCGFGLRPETSNILPGDTDVARLGTTGGGPGPSHTGSPRPPPPARSPLRWDRAWPPLPQLQPHLTRYPSFVFSFGGTYRPLKSLSVFRGPFIVYLTPSRISTQESGSVLYVQFLEEQAALWKSFLKKETSVLFLALFSASSTDLAHNKHSIAID